MTRSMTTSLKARRKRQRTRGNTMIEAAITMVLFFTLLFGIVGWGRAVWAYVWTSHSAREASRWASVRGSKSSGATSNTAVTTFVKSQTAGLDPTAVTVNATWPDGNEDPGSRVTVSVQYSVTQLVPFVPAITVSSSSTMVIAQ